MPRVQVLHEKYANNPDIVILAMNVGDENDKMTKWWKEKKYTFPSLHDADDLAEKYGIKAFPTTIMIGPDGTVLAAQVGSPTAIEAAIEKALGDIKK